MKWLIKNPITFWLSKLYIAKRLEWENKDNNLKIGYLSYAKNSYFGLYNTLQNNVSLVDVELGNFTYISFRTTIAKTKIGKFCSIGPDCKIGLGKHPSNTFVSTHPIFFSTIKQVQISFADKNYFSESDNIVIGNDVWIGANSVILDGVNISNGVIVAAGSVVTKDIPPYAIVGGVPAKIIKYRFDKEQIDKLLKLKWWDMSLEYFQKNFQDFHNVDLLLNSKLNPPP